MKPFFPKKYILFRNLHVLVSEWSRKFAKDKQRSGDNFVQTGHMVNEKSLLTVIYHISNFLLKFVRLNVLQMPEAITISIKFRVQKYMCNRFFHFASFRHDKSITILVTRWPSLAHVQKTLPFVVSQLKFSFFKHYCYQYSHL